MHVFIQEVFVFTGTVGRGGGCVSHHALCGDLRQQPRLKVSGAIPGGHGGVVIIGEDALEAA